MPLLLMKVKQNPKQSVFVRNFFIEEAGRTCYQSEIMKHYVTLLILLLGSMLFVSCSHKTLTSESGLYNVTLNEHLKSPVDGMWTWGKGNPYLKQKSGFIYIAPLNISMVAKEHPNLAPLMRPQMHDYMVQAYANMLKDANAKNGTNWQLTFNPAQANVRIDMALVAFEPQRPKLRLVGELLGFMAPVPGIGRVVGKFSKGDITIEATIRDCKNNQLLMALKDSNRKSTRLYSAEAYTKEGNADVNLRSWARMLAHICRLAWYDELGTSTLQEKFKDYTYLEAIKDHIVD